MIMITPIIVDNDWWYTIILLIITTSIMILIITHARIDTSSLNHLFITSSLHLTLDPQRDPSMARSLRPKHSCRASEPSHGDVSQLLWDFGWDFSGVTEFPSRELTYSTLGMQLTMSSGGRCCTVDVCRSWAGDAGVTRLELFVDCVTTTIVKYQSDKRNMCDHGCTENLSPGQSLMRIPLTIRSLLLDLSIMHGDLLHDVEVCQWQSFIGVQGRPILVNQKRNFDSLSKLDAQRPYVGGKLANVFPFDRSGPAVVILEFSDPDIHWCPLQNQVE